MNGIIIVSFPKIVTVLLYEGSVVTDLNLNTV